MKQKTLIGSSGFTNHDLYSILKLTINKKIIPVIDSVFSMEQIPQACEKLKSRQVFGKIIIKVI